MTKNKVKFDKFSLSVLIAQALVAIFTVVSSLLNIQSQELLLDSRYNLLKGFVDKAEWYVFYLPVISVVFIVVINFIIVRTNHKIVDKILVHSYLFGSLIAQLLAVVVIMSMQAAVGF